jgi:16S rRNA (guanine527-N7)-methyltransferase
LLADELPARAEVLDVGSGAGLPGVVLAIRRPELSVTQLEPMQRRVAFLAEAIDVLGLADTVSVVRGRAEATETRRQLGARPWVVARAVAPLERLAAWCLPLLAPGGRLLALKGARAEEEAATARRSLTRLGGRVSGVRELAGVRGVDPTWVVVVERTGGGRPPGEEKCSR